MCDEHDAQPGGAPDGQKFVLQALAGHRVERAERFVHQCHLRVVGQHTADGDALLHAAGQLVRVAVGEAIQPHHRNEAIGGRHRLGFRFAAGDRAEGDVLPDGQPGKQTIVLEHHATVRAGAGDRLGRAW